MTAECKLHPQPYAWGTLINSTVPYSNCQGAKACTKWEAGSVASTDQPLLRVPKSDTTHGDNHQACCIFIQWMLPRRTSNSLCLQALVGNSCPFQGLGGGSLQRLDHLELQQTAGAPGRLAVPKAQLRQT